jgi:hypothetical protein
MIRTTFVAALLLGMANPALAQGGPPPSPYAPLQDRPTCTRDELKAATAAYVEAQRRGDISRLPLHEKARFLENMADVERGAGLWNTALPVDTTLSFHDATRCKTFTEITVTEGGHPYVIGTRLYLHQGKVIRVDSLVTDPGDWLFNANAFAKYTRAEDWSPLHVYQRTSPAEMIRGANAYLDAFSDKFTDIPWGIPCARLEGGAYTNRDGKPDASCEIGIPAGVLYIVNRDYLVDEELGVVNVYCRFGNSTSGMPDSHTFRYIDGKMRNVHTLSVNLGSTPSPQADDNGAMVRTPS